MVLLLETPCSSFACSFVHLFNCLSVRSRKVAILFFWASLGILGLFGYPWTKEMSNPKGFNWPKVAQKGLQWSNWPKMAKTLLEVAELVQSCAKLARGAKTQNLEDGNFFGVKFQVAMLPCYPGFCTSGVGHKVQNDPKGQKKGTEGPLWLKQPRGPNWPKGLKVVQNGCIDYKMANLPQMTKHSGLLKFWPTIYQWILGYLNLPHKVSTHIVF